MALLPYLSLLIILVLGASNALSSISSCQTPSNYFCDETGGGYGNFSVYDTQTGETVGCLDENARWVVDGSCGLFNAVIEAGGPGGDDIKDHLHTRAGWCFNSGDPNIVNGYTFYCRPDVAFGQGTTIFNCIQLQPEAGLSSYNGHAPFSHRALEQPLGNQKVNVTWQPSSDAAGFAVKLFWQPA